MIHDLARGPAKALAATLKTASSGQIFQVRNHVKMYPWRRHRDAAYSHLDNTRTPYTDKHNINEFRSDERQLKPWQKVIYKDKDHRFNAYQRNDSYVSDPKRARGIAMDKFKSLADSLSSRGHARQRQAYSPPQDVEEKILGICKSVGLQKEDSLSDRELKFRFISACIATFNHHLPSSYLNDMDTVQDVIEYFSTEVLGVNPYDNLVSKTNELPPNLAIIAEPHRFNKESDPMFGGHTALPGVVSRVPGLRAAKKYPVLNQDEFQWPDI